MKKEDYTIEWCPHCDTEQVIYSEGVTACLKCHKPLLPCSVCEDGCRITQPCPYDMTGALGDDKIPVIRKITSAEKKWYLKQIKEETK